MVGGAGRRSASAGHDRPVRVCMVVPTLGERLDWLGHCLRSIREQQPAAPVQVRVVTPRPDRVAAVCREHGADVVAQHQGRLSAAINLGWSGSTAEALAWLGDDDLLAPGSLAATLAALRADPRVDLVYGRVRYIDADGATMWLQRPGRWAARYIHVGKNLVPQQGSLFRASAVAAVGGVDEAWRSAMDQDLIQRLTRHGRWVYLPREVGAFRLHGSGITETKALTGDDESEQLRRLHGPRWYPAFRPAVPVVDRLVYGAMRRVPATAVPLVDGRPYTQRAD
jgi:glycosyltransferase involved in cell wall biosynthesis